jgi:hypothetical protein
MRQGFVNQREMTKHAAPDDTGFNLRKLEGERLCMCRCSGADIER